MSELQWYKGNLHTHTTKSDGDADPKFVTKWYRMHGYDFLVLSDHNHRTMFEYRPGKRRFKRPLMVPGEEVSVNILQGTVPVHVNGIGISATIDPIDSRTGGPDEVVPTLQANIDAILESGGIAMINHPNYTWAVDHKSINQTTIIPSANWIRSLFRIRRLR